MPYEFVPSIVRYRDVTTGRFVPRSRVTSYADAAVLAGSDAGNVLAGLVSSGELSPADWAEQLRQEVKASFIQEYILGRGGRDSMTPRDWGTVGHQLREQYQYLDGFEQDVEDDALSEAQISARSSLYFQSSKTAYERGQASAWDIKLPGYPGDGKTECKSGCLCYWTIKRQDAHTVVASWTRTIAESCPGCLQRADEWAQLIYVDGVLKGEALATFGGLRL